MKVVLIPRMILVPEILLVNLLQVPWIEQEPHITRGQAAQVNPPRIRHPQVGWPAQR